jgi:hypothetical protein
MPSASDWRAAANTRSEIRKILRTDGMLPTTEQKPATVKMPDRTTLLERRVVVLERHNAVLERRLTTIEQTLSRPGEITNA